MFAHPSLPQLDLGLLTAVARSALDRPTAAVTACEPPTLLTTPEAVVNLTSDGVYRVRGTASDTAVGASLPWSAAGQDETVAIDWAWAGIGALGEELGPLVVATVLDGALPVEALPELEAAALEGYLDGLADAGWYGDPRLVWLGYAASAPLRYAFLLAADVARATFDESFRVAQEARHGVSTETVARRRGAVIAFLLDRADEVCALAS